MHLRFLVCVSLPVSCWERERQRQQNLTRESKREADGREQETRPNMGTGDAQRIPSFHSNRQVQDIGS